MVATNANEVDIAEELEHLLDCPYEIPDGSIVVACRTAAQAATLTDRLLSASSEEAFHIEQFPVTDDESGRVEYIAWIVRRLVYDRAVGWTSSDASRSPDFDLR